MSDRTLRTLARRWQETGAIEDEARYLQGMVRAQQLPQINLRLAALMGCPPAVVAMGPGPEGFTHVDDWVSELRKVGGDWTKTLLLRCAHAASWVTALHLHARLNACWMSGAVGRVFQLSALRILGGVEPDPSEVITPLNSEWDELLGALRFGDAATAFFALRHTAAHYARGADEQTVAAGCIYALKFAEGVLGADGVYHACAFLVGPYFLYGEDPMLWWRDDVRTLHRDLNLYVRRSPWYEDAA